MSLGRCFAGHSFENKLDMAQKYGYQGIELFYEDLVDIAQKKCDEPFSSDGPSEGSQMAAAREVQRICQSRGLEIVCLQPFMHYEGLVNREQYGRMLRKFELFIRLAHILETDIIQVPSNFLPASQVTTDLDLIVSDLQHAADIGLGASPPIRLVYESLCWGTRVDTWEKCWDVVRRVDRPNFGICLDSFNIAGRIYADPTSPTGRTPDADAAVEKSMARLVKTVDVSKVFYVQIVDAERLQEPLVAGHKLYDADQPARMSWSRSCRLFYGEEDRGAYLPVKKVADTIFHGLKFQGWVSLELFNRRMSEEGSEIPEELARRGAVSWKKLVQDMKLQTRTSEPVRISASL